MQKFDPILVQKKEFCLNDREQFKTMFEDIDLNMQIGGKYPVLMKIVALKRHWRNFFSYNILMIMFY